MRTLDAQGPCVCEKNMTKAQGILTLYKHDHQNEIALPTWLPACNTPVFTSPTRLQVWTGEWPVSDPLPKGAAEQDHRDQPHQHQRQ